MSDDADDDADSDSDDIDEEQVARDRELMRAAIDGDAGAPSSSTAGEASSSTQAAARTTEQDDDEEQEYAQAAEEAQLAEYAEATSEEAVEAAAALQPQPQQPQQNRPLHTSAPAAAQKRVIVTQVALKEGVLFDMGACIRRFEVGDEHTFAAFKMVWRAMKFQDIFASAKQQKRVPEFGETGAKYVRMLLIAAGKHLGGADATWDEPGGQRVSQPSELPDEWRASLVHRLGGLFLVYTMHALQPVAPPEPVPVSSADWKALLVLEVELDDEAHEGRYADGLKALRGLRRGGVAVIEHTLEHGLHVGNQMADRAAQLNATALPLSSSVAELGACAYTRRLRGQALPQLEQLERDYAAQRSSTGLQPGREPPLSARLDDAYNSYMTGQPMPDQMADGDTSFERRQALRDRRYSHAEETQREKRSRLLSHVSQVS
tara:strand:+ start:6 stop:1304 length:1299 start_codon:yes stop_codon:yes gene_type:complete